MGPGRIEEEVESTSKSSEEVVGGKFEPDPSSPSRSLSLALGSQP